MFVQINEENVSEHARVGNSKKGRREKLYYVISHAHNIYMYVCLYVCVFF